ncbi:ribosomal protein S5 domain 2-like protein [Calocera viscosa TUFC12733]|uniref:Ribosomal RNA-processing protein 43 n=1 Tax=Calocera viscosa (strain TUFC12733) TaxID=1330018 RepID=A0A167QVI5_CALVF|nr:ribosomal protein S5 domain 2-like protein [Calocera viscosa TUFC12733]
MDDPTPSSSSSAKLDPEIYSRLHPRAYLERFLASSYRPSGRTPAASRPAQVHLGSISTADGSALARLGETTVVCGVKAELAEPDAGGERRGWVVPNLDLPAVCGARFRPGPPGEEAQVCSERLFELLIECKRNEVISLEELCIEPARAAWVLYIDLVCINYDGNAYDASVLAMLAALRNTRLPKARWDEDKKRVVCSRKERVPLRVQNLPIPSTFGIFDGQHLLADPNAFEEPLLDTLITVTLDDRGKVGVQLAGPAGVSGIDGSKVVGQCVQAARARRKELLRALDGT